MVAGQIMFSVIVPIYNVEKYLRICIDSILNQTYPNFELILVNDGSTDNCGKICEEYRTKDARIVLINQENQGLLAARRVGLHHAGGDYIVHVDSDDYCSTTLLESLNKKIIETHCDLILYGYSFVDNCGNEIKKVQVDGLGSENEPVPKEILIEAMVNTFKYNSIWMKCAKRSIVDIDADYSRYGRLMMGEDVLQSMPLIENASSIGLVDMPLYMYRITTGSMSRRIQKEYIYHYLQVRKRVYETMNKCGCTDHSFMSDFFSHYHHGVAMYLLALTHVCSRTEFKTIVDDIKSKMLSDTEYDDLFLSALDRICFHIAMNKQYVLCKILAILRSELRRFRKSRFKFSNG